MSSPPAIARPFRAAVAALGLSVLAGCGNVPEMLDPVHVAQQRLAYRPGVSEIYCYRTLAAVDCYAEPQPGPPNRLVNGYADLIAE